MRTEYWKSSVSLLSHRFVFFDGGAGGGPSENFNPEAGGEAGAAVSEAAAERAAEERRQSAAAAKQQRREEKKVKKRDYKLAAIIEDFINGPQRDDHIALLLSRLLQRNTPVSILLAVLSINYHDVIEELENYLEEERDVMPDVTPLEQQADASSTALVAYGKEMAETLSVWTRRLFTHASFHPMKSILALAHHHGVDHHMIELTTLMIQRFFEKSGQEIEFSRIREFSEMFWRDTLRRLHQLANDRGLLPNPAQDPLENDEDDDE